MDTEKAEGPVAVAEKPEEFNFPGGDTKRDAYPEDLQKKKVTSPDVTTPTVTTPDAITPTVSEGGFSGFFKNLFGRNKAVTQEPQEPTIAEPTPVEPSEV